MVKKTKAKNINWYKEFKEISKYIFVLVFIFILGYSSNDCSDSEQSEESSYSYKYYNAKEYCEVFGYDDLMYDAFCIDNGYTKAKSVWEDCNSKDSNGKCGVIIYCDEKTTDCVLIYEKVVCRDKVNNVFGSEEYNIWMTTYPLSKEYILSECIRQRMCDSGYCEVID